MPIVPEAPETRLQADGAAPDRPPAVPGVGTAQTQALVRAPPAPGAPTGHALATEPTVNEPLRPPAPALTAATAPDADYGWGQCPADDDGVEETANQDVNGAEPTADEPWRPPAPALTAATAPDADYDWGQCPPDDDGVEQAAHRDVTGAEQQFRPRILQKIGEITRGREEELKSLMKSDGWVEKIETKGKDCTRTVYIRETSDNRRKRFDSLLEAARKHYPEFLHGYSATKLPAAVRAALNAAHEDSEVPSEDGPVVVFSLPSAEEQKEKMEREMFRMGRVKARNLQLKELKEKHYHVEAFEVDSEFLNKHPMKFRVKDVESWVAGAFIAAVERDPATGARLKETLVKDAREGDIPSLMHLYALLFSTATRTSCAALSKGEHGLYAFDTRKGPRGFRAHKPDKKGILVDEAKQVYKAYFTQYAQEKRHSRLGDCYRDTDIPWNAAILVTEFKMRRCAKMYAEQTPCGRIVIFPEQVREHCGDLQGLVNVLNEALEVIVSLDLSDDFGCIVTRQTCDWILWSLCTTPEMRRRVDMHDLAVVRSLFAHWQLAKVAKHRKIYKDKTFAGLVIYYCILHHYMKRQGKCKTTDYLEGEVRYPLPKNFDVEKHAGLVYGWAEYDKWWQTKRQDGNTGSQMYTVTHNRNQYMYAEAF